MLWLNHVLEYYEATFLKLDEGCGSHRSKGSAPTVTVWRAFVRPCLSSFLLEWMGVSVSSYDLFVLMVGLECAMFPVLYPTTDFTDTGIREHYQHDHNDDRNRVISVGLSYTRKVLSSVRAYAEQRDLAFFLYERYLANKFFTAQCRAQRMGVTGDSGISILILSQVCFSCVLVEHGGALVVPMIDRCICLMSVTLAVPP